MWVALCPNCTLPSVVDADGRSEPPPPYGEDIEHLPGAVESLYNEGRRALQHGAPTAAVMVGRKLLMNLAVHEGAEGNESFRFYVNYLADKGIVTSAMAEWIDEIRELGNDASHELPAMTREEADALLTFVAMLLRIVYEYPERGRQSVAARAAKTSEASS